jgi:hypothetical protein
MAGLSGTQRPGQGSSAAMMERSIAPRRQHLHRIAVQAGAGNRKDG